MTFFRRAATRLGDALFPPTCPGCGAETAEAHALCAACWRETGFIAGPICECCGRPAEGIGRPDPGFRCGACLAHPPAWDRARAAAVYAGTARRLILGLKHGDRLDVAPLLGRWIARAGAEMLAGADAVIPVPLHWTRRLRRRTNQSAEVARAALAEIGRPGIHRPLALARARRTPSQAGRGRAARSANVAGAFAVPPGARAALAGARVVLVDDVLTTGATLSAAAAALRDVGASHVDALVVALVHRPDDTYLAAESVAEEW